MSLQSFILTITILAAANPINDFNKIAKTNTLKKEARVAYNEGDYEIAAQKWQYLLDSMRIDDDKIRLNLANANFNLGNHDAAIQGYNQLTHSQDRSIRSVAQQQLGIKAHQEKQYEKALEHFKKSLKADPTNEASRYNYELLKKLHKDQEDEQNEDEQENNDDQNDQDQSDQDDGDQNQEDQEDNGEQDKNDPNDDADEKEQDQSDGEEDQADEDMNEEEEKEQESSSEDDESEEDREDAPDSSEENFENMPINEEAARMILEAMKNQEIQYIQQNKRKPTKRPDPKKPDW